MSVQANSKQISQLLFQGILRQTITKGELRFHVNRNRGPMTQTRTLLCYALRRHQYVFHDSAISLLKVTLTEKQDLQKLEKRTNKNNTIPRQLIETEQQTRDKNNTTA